MMETKMSGPLFLYLDCETIPSQDPAVLERILLEHLVPEPDLSALVADGRLTDPARIEADLAKKREKAMADYEIDLAKAEAKGDTVYRKLCLAGATAHIACVHYALGDGDVAGHLNFALETFDGKYKVPTFQEVLDAERQMLQEFVAELRDWIFEIAQERAEAEWAAMDAKTDSIGFIDEGGGYVRKLPSMGREAWVEQNRRRFVHVPIVVAHSADLDVRMIWQRSKILGVTLPVWWPITFNRYRTDEVEDTMVMWAGHTERISLEDLCVALGIPGKGDGLDGSQVWNAIQQGRLWDVSVYCGQHVGRCRAAHKRLRGPAKADVVQVWSNEHGRPRVVEEAVVDTDGLFDAAAAAADADHGVAAEVAS
jgi:hypothetical protein